MAEMGEKEVERLAELARIELAPEERALLARDLAAILDH
ncbi:MAG: Asp-tRNA(Asn)/Glu-tRNA(Gln) amidotransferase GatCAB subunit C, partial [Candidatus Colwellbacteria bacterium]|nr:Asp-tRNA(Asn)/Glu-tRNA(Gln) amidotransferase GatCAB subunit C [Candidatus Colwellbacteria bacterium]